MGCGSIKLKMPYKLFIAEESQQVDWNWQIFTKPMVLLQRRRVILIRYAQGRIVGTRFMGTLRSSPTWLKKFSVGPFRGYRQPVSGNNRQNEHCMEFLCSENQEAELGGTDCMFSGVISGYVQFLFYYLEKWKLSLGLQIVACISPSCPTFPHFHVEHKSLKLKQLAEYQIIEY